jgi:hypothetical protein
MKYTGVTGSVSAAATNYDAHATAGTLHLVTRSPTVGGAVTINEMRGLYKTQMSAASGAGRSYYDALKNAAPNKKCPLCGVGVVSTLDHHLPQSKYPDLTVCPLNLVPSCGDCNKWKWAKYPISAAEQTIHPYFDDFTQAQWLHAYIDHGPPLTAQFGVVPPAGWPAIDGQRADRHFTVFKLAVLFGVNANDELALIRPTLVSLFDAGGDVAVQSHLIDEAVKHSPRLNSWQHALYLAASNDAWFYSGGFVNIPEPNPN